MKPKPSRLARAAKRALDIAGAALLLLLLSPLLALIWLLVRLDDGPPVLYRRRVVGVAGDFDAFKFRSMRVDAEQALARDSALQAAFQSNYKLRQDPRVTRLGRLLRRYSLDELPQLLNVLRGQMSLVGPRMISPEELPRYGDQSALLLSVRPGLTGYWQVSGRQTRSYEQRVAMDTYYITHWTLLFDLKILLKTPYKVFRAEGAY